MPSAQSSVRSYGQRAPGSGNIKVRGFDFHPQVFPASVGLIVLFVASTLVFSDLAEGVFATVQNAITSFFGWFMVFAATVFLCFVLILAAGKYGQVRLGGPDARPDFPLEAWLAMLMSAGMGIGLMFWSVAEPIEHLQTPPSPLGLVEPGTAAAAKQAMGITLFHWTFHAWGIYALVGLALAYFAYNHGLPLTMRSVFYPLLGDRITGPIGHAIDILAIGATLFGLATSLGLGVQQVNAGLDYLFGIPITEGVQILLIAVITGFATASVISGLNGGVRRLSELNMLLAGVLMTFVLIVGPTLFLLNSFVDDIGYYLSILPAMSFWTEAFEGTTWQAEWTLFYWGWWISWSPYVGIFIARISKGRTIREFVLGVLLLPSMLTFLWMTVMGGTALNMELADSAGLISEAVSENIATALFVMLQQLPLAGLTSLVGIVLVVVFFVTSSDSGSLVVDNLAAGGKLNTPTTQRVFWAVSEGVVAGVLLIGGGLQALQTAAIATGLPFAVLLLVMCFSLYRGLSRDVASPSP